MKYDAADGEHTVYFIKIPSEDPLKTKVPAFLKAPIGVNLNELSFESVEFLDSSAHLQEMVASIQAKKTFSYDSEASEISYDIASHFEERVAQPEDQGPPAPRHGDLCPLSCNIF